MTTPRSYESQQPLSQMGISRHPLFSIRPLSRHSSKWHKLELAGPFFRVARGPDEKQALDDLGYWSALVDKKQTVHR